MSKRLWRKAVPTAAGTVAISLAATTGALGSSLSPPVLKSPGQGKRVHAGVITLIVDDPGLPKGAQPVYVAIDPKRELNRDGYLKEAPKGCGSKCDFVSLKPRRNHPGEWIYRTAFNFPGYWAVTRGKYYWQADFVPPLCDNGAAKGCEVVSAIHTFRVVG